MTNSDDIIRDIDNKINKEGSGYPNWYVGITININRRLYEEHNVPKKDHWFITRNADSNDDALDIENHFHRLGCQGGGSPSPGLEDTTWVYAYKITTITKE